MVFENELDFGAPKALDPTVLGHGHGQISHLAIGNFSRQFSAGPELTARRRSTTGQRVYDTDLDLFNSPRARGRQKDHHQHYGKNGKTGFDQCFHLLIPPYLLGQSPMG